MNTLIEEFIMKVKHFCLYALYGTLMFLFACSSNNPVQPPDNSEPVNETVQTASKSSVDIYQNVASFKTITNFMQGESGLAELDVPAVQNPTAAMRFFGDVRQQAMQKLRPIIKRGNSLQSAMGDSVIWDVTERDSVAGVTHRILLTYNPQTGVGILTVVSFDFDESQPLEYDSTRVVVDINFTILDESDDVLVSLESLKRFKPGRLIHEEHGTFTPDPYSPGSEPDGGVLTARVTYRSSSFISSTDERFEYHAGQGGSYTKTTAFSDGKSHVESITFNEDGTGTYTETRRDGTHIEGSFDSADEDGQGSYSTTITFPDGHDPVSIAESGTFSMNLADSTLSGTFTRTVTRQDGTVEEESVTISQTLEGDVRTTMLEVSNADGSGGSITITEAPDVEQITGEWVEADGTFNKFTAEGYADGSAHLIFDVYASAASFENGDDPVASGEFDFYPDGSGSGTITMDGVTYNVTINPDGSVTIEPQN